MQEQNHKSQDNFFSSAVKAESAATTSGPHFEKVKHFVDATHAGGIYNLKKLSCNSSSGEEAHWRTAPSEQSDNTWAGKHGTVKESTDPRAANQNNSVSKGEYSDKMAVQQTGDALEQGFLQDFSKLLKEYHNATHAEFSRYHERLNETNVHYRDKLMALLMEQGKIREELLRKEFQSRFQQYQQSRNTNSMAQYLNNHPPPLPSGIHHSHLPAGGYNMEGTQRTTSLLVPAYHAEGYHGGYSGDAALRAPCPTQAGHYESGDHPHGRELEPRYAGGTCRL